MRGLLRTTHSVGQLGALMAQIQERAPMLPRLPVFGWAMFAGRRHSGLPCVLDAPNLKFTNSGRAAIVHALRILGVGTGDRVLVPTYHCPTMIAPVVSLGAEPLFFPIDDDGAPALDAIAGNHLSNVRAMIAAHYFGLPIPMARIRAFCDQHGIALIEDCAHAMFGLADGQPVGSWGDYAIASLTKFVPATNGGCLLSWRNPLHTLALEPRSAVEELRSVANAIEMGVAHRRLAGMNTLLSLAFALAGVGRGTRRAGNPPDNSRAGITKWLADYLAGAPAWRPPAAWSVWTAQVARRDRIVSLRRRNYHQLAMRLSNIPGIRVPWPTLPDSAAPYVFPLWVDVPEPSYQLVRSAGVPVYRWDETWPTAPRIPGDRGHVWATHVFQLGCHQDLCSADLERIAGALEDIFARSSQRQASQNTK
jgi:perosamine synthetase